MSAARRKAVKGKSGSAGKSAAAGKPGTKPESAKTGGTKAKKPPRARADEASPEIERRVRWAVLGAMAVATVAFFASFVFDGDAMLFGTDMLAQAYQSRAFAVQEVLAGRGLPQWNPYVYGGLPYLSILPYPVYYPTSLLYFVIDLHRAIGWAFVLHFLLAGALAYALARELGLRAGAAAVTGVAYMFTGYLVSHLYAGQDGRMFAMTWTPAVFLFAERAIARRRLHWFLWMAAVVALQVFTPHVQMMYFAAMAVGAYVLFRLHQVRVEMRGWKTPLVLLAGFVGAYLLAGLITLVEVWPTWNMVQFSHRAERGYEYASSWSMPVRETLATIWPRFQGYLESYWGTNPFKLHTEYLGAVPVMLALLALTVRRSATVWFFAALAALGLVFAWGGATPLHRLFYWILPMMKSFRAPAMMYSIVALAVVVLAGHGAQALYDRRSELAEGRHVAWKVIGGLGALWIVLWFWAAGSPDGFGGFWRGLLYGGSLEPGRAQAAAAAMPVFARSFGLFALFWALGAGICWLAARERIGALAACLALALLAGVDLWRVDRDFYAVVPAERIVEPGPAVEWLREEPEPFRALPLPGAFGPNDLMLFGIPTVTGSQNFRLLWWDDLVGEGGARLAETKLWPLLNLRYVISDRPLELGGLGLAFDRGPLVYRFEGTAGGAWLVHEARERPASETPASAVLDGSFDPMRTALLEPGVAAPPLAPATGPEPAPAWSIREPDRLALEVEPAADAILVLSEIWHPYWSARVDGEPAQVLQVDVALRGVPVPAGRHSVELEFRDTNVAYGAWGSAIGLAILASLLVATRRHRDPAPPDETAA
ncbi:MAG TPA: hypothetical protein VFH11_11445 [Gemmatimonadota bacterium]|nr:hypothetical protein [Gemmatimonadota bacterium]